MWMVGVEFYECLSCVMISTGNMYERFQVFFYVSGIVQSNKGTHCAKSIKLSVPETKIQLKTWDDMHCCDIFLMLKVSTPYSTDDQTKYVMNSILDDIKCLVFVITVHICRISLHFLCFRGLFSSNLQFSIIRLDTPTCNIRFVFLIFIFVPKCVPSSYTFFSPVFAFVLIFGGYWCVIHIPTLANRLAPTETPSTCFCNHSENELH